MSSAAVGVCVAAAIMAVSGAASGGPTASVDPRVLADTAGGRSASFLVVLRGQADVAGATVAATDRAVQGRRALLALRRAAAAQTGLRATLRELGVPYRPFWVVNALAVTGDRRVVTALATREEVAAIESDRAFSVPTAETVASSSLAPRGVEWNVEKIGAPAVWALGFTGQGMIYANADTGVQWESPTLKRQYRGWDGTAANHAYSWWDAVHGDLSGNGGNPCGFDLRAPCDDERGSHGTHTMGTAVGDDGAGNQIGVAPGARWIACRNMDEGYGRPSTYIECLQFFLAPTDLDGRNPDPTRRPNVVGNSYACPPEEGCSVDALQAAVDNVRAAGVFMAVAAGNEGRTGCATIVWPPAQYDSAVTVGATDASDQIATFSSRGPVLVDGSGRPKPDLAAPGVGIRSAIASGFGVKSGTSMAAPHLGGAVLLLWSAFPQLRGNVDATEQLLKDTAVRRTTTDGCGGDTPTTLPNNTYGSGRIDVAAAFRAAEAASPPAVSVADVSVVEGNAGRRDASFAVTLSRMSTQPVAVAFASRGRTARAGSDFVAVSGKLSFAAGETTKAIVVPVLGDRVIESDETFELTLSSPEGATLERATAIGTISNDDVDRRRPVLSKLAVRPAPAPAGGRATLGFRLSEPAVVACTLARAAQPARAVRTLRTQGVAGANALGIALRGLGSGVIRVACVPTDGAGNVGRRSVTTFRIV